MANYEISVIQGDATEYWFEFEENLRADAVFLSCPFLDLSIYLEYSSGMNAYCLALPTQVTRRFKPCTCYFDVTAVKAGQQMTLIHKGLFKVTAKINKDFYFTIKAQKGEDFRHVFNTIHKESIPLVEWVDFVCPLQNGFRKEIHFTPHGEMLLIIPKDEMDTLETDTCDYFLEVMYKDEKRPQICGSGFWDVEA